ncbi:hypothetical protein [Hymenobacter metallicola]|uniref:Uncharacterized protein n=1 Tax=Hymenobacter metallicola TaxID=2563114 RepID=A0A4Z0PTF4_9BACT|nr:hypothetical protein [Hymenobacter metallicola]TGE21050.1 hypothetical protein E5K02_23860 [Hymenobacter metallicola]
MQQSREWLGQHGDKLLLALSLFLVVSGLVGHWRGRSSVLVTADQAAGQVKHSPVWLLYACAVVPLLIIALRRRRKKLH